MATPTAPRTPDPLTEVLPQLMADLRAARARRAAELQAHHDSEPAELEDRFAHLAIDHPDAITYDHNWQPGGAK